MPVVARGFEVDFGCFFTTQKNWDIAIASNYRSWEIVLCNSELLKRPITVWNGCLKLATFMQIWYINDRFITFLLDDSRFQCLSIFTLFASINLLICLDCKVFKQYCFMDCFVCITKLQKWENYVKPPVMIIIFLGKNFQSTSFIFHCVLKRISIIQSSFSLILKHSGLIYWCKRALYLLI